MKNPWKREMISKTARQLIIQTTITFYYFFKIFLTLLKTEKKSGVVYKKNYSGFWFPVFFPMIFWLFLSQNGNLYFFECFYEFH